MPEIELGNLTVELVVAPSGPPRSTGIETDMKPVTVQEARLLPTFGRLVTEELPGGYALREISYASVPVQTMISTFSRNDAAPVVLVAAPKSQYENGSYFVVGDSLESSGIEGKPAAFVRRQTKFSETTSMIWEGENLVGQLIGQQLTAQDLLKLMRGLDF